MLCDLYADGIPHQAGTNHRHQRGEPAASGHDACQHGGDDEEYPRDDLDCSPHLSATSQFGSLISFLDSPRNDLQAQSTVAAELLIRLGIASTIWTIHSLAYLNLDFAA